MKQLTSVLFGVVVLLLTAACQEKQEMEVLVSSVTLDKPSVSLYVGETVSLTATILPDDATDKALKWSSSNTSVATVDGGVVTALSEGTATITVSAGSKLAQCVVTVNKPVIKVESVTLDKTSITLEEGESKTLTATVLPSDATDLTVTWTTDNPSVATVEDGVVTAVSEGTATITAMAGDKSATCAVTVSKKYIAVESITLDRPSVSLEEGESTTLIATVLPGDATEPTVTWATDNPDVATVVEGVVTAVSEGTATITATAGDKSATCTVTVSKKYIAVESITLDRPSVSLEEGESTTLTATVLPGDATDPTITWTSDNPSVATVEDGVVTAVAAGTATITATVGDKSATCTVTVYASVVSVIGVTLDKTSVELTKGESITLVATVIPSNATDKSVTWSSDNPDVATVEDGVVKAKVSGKAVITVQTNFGGFKATCEVKVLNSSGSGLPLGDMDDEGNLFDPETFQD